MLNSVRRLYTALIVFIGLIFQIMLTEASEQTIPEFIEMHRDNPEIVLNRRTCARNAKLFYISFISGSPSEGYLKKRTSHLEKAAKKVQAQGAELIICVYNLQHFKEAYEDVVKQAKKCSIKCPIINSTEAVTRKTIYGNPGIIASSGVTVVDTQGRILCNFYKNNDETYIRETGSKGQPYDIKLNPRNSWEAEIITHSCRDLLQKYATSSMADKPAPQEKQKKKTKKEADKPAPKRWQKLDI